MPTLDLSNFNIVCAVMGGFVTVFGLVSYLCKERFYLSEALISLAAGILFSHGTDFIRPLEYTFGSEERLATATLYFTRLVLGVQLVLAGKFSHSLCRCHSHVACSIITLCSSAVSVIFTLCDLNCSLLMP